MIKIAVSRYFRDLSPTTFSGETVNKSSTNRHHYAGGCEKMAQAVEAKALEINVPVVFSVVDRGGKYAADATHGRRVRHQL
jgi:hypothetical protein